MPGSRSGPGILPYHSTGRTRWRQRTVPSCTKCYRQCLRYGWKDKDADWTTICWVEPQTGQTPLAWNVQVRSWQRIEGDRLYWNRIFRYRRSEFLTYRIITIPPRLHQLLQGSSDVHEYEARNIGIRFARGEFVVTANPGSIWTSIDISNYAYLTYWFIY